MAILKYNPHRLPTLRKLPEPAIPMHPIRPILLLALISLPLVLAPNRAEGQSRDRLAIQAVMDAVPPGDRKVFVSPLLMRHSIDAVITIQDPHLEPLKQRYRATVKRWEEVLECRDPAIWATCTIPEGGIFYQFLMPEPIDGGRLTIELIRYVGNAGANGEIIRELWLTTLVQRPNVGWTVVRKELTEEAAQIPG